VASDDRFEALRNVSDSVVMEVRSRGKPFRQRSYLSEILDLAHDTGRRITAICSLRYQDLRLEPRSDAPHGAIRWPEVTDKEGREWIAPISPRVRNALDRVFRDRPGIGPAYIFPCPTDPARPVQYERVRTWLRRAETLANLPNQRGSSFHAYRRAWATARKHLPVTDVAAAGG
jgi:integrase